MYFSLCSTIEVDYSCCVSWFSYLQVFSRKTYGQAFYIIHPMSKFSLNTAVRTKLDLTQPYLCHATKHNRSTRTNKIDKEIQIDWSQGIVIMTKFVTVILLSKRRKDMEYNWNSMHD